jgi:hypothetical protein
MATRDTEREGRLFVRPAPGRLIRHPVTMRPLRDEGEDVTSARFYFHRMIRAGDVIVVPRPAKPEKTEI